MARIGWQVNQEETKENANHIDKVFEEKKEDDVSSFDKVPVKELA